MFARRPILKRSVTSATPGATPAGSAGAAKPDVRHPAMRGLNISPVHGHHCICGRCQSRADAA